MSLFFCNSVTFAIVDEKSESFVPFRNKQLGGCPFGPSQFNDVFGKRLILLALSKSLLLTPDRYWEKYTGPMSGPRSPMRCLATLNRLK